MEDSAVEGQPGFRPGMKTNELCGHEHLCTFTPLSINKGSSDWVSETEEFLPTK